MDWSKVGPVLIALELRKLATQSTTLEDDMAEALRLVAVAKAKAKATPARPAEEAKPAKRNKKPKKPGGGG
jgi:hypothetical protein